MAMPQKNAQHLAQRLLNQTNTAPYAERPSMTATVHAFRSPQIPTPPAATPTTMLPSMLPGTPAAKPRRPRPASARSTPQQVEAPIAHETATPTARASVASTPARLTLGQWAHGIARGTRLTLIDRTPRLLAPVAFVVRHSGTILQGLAIAAAPAGLGLFALHSSPVLRQSLLFTSLPETVAAMAMLYTLCGATLLVGTLLSQAFLHGVQGALRTLAQKGLNTPDAR